MDDLLLGRDRNPICLTTYGELIDYVVHGDFRLFGMDKDAILALLECYHVSGGKHPITAESVRELYGNR